jgi:hypothetical protein
VPSPDPKAGEGAAGADTVRVTKLRLTMLLFYHQVLQMDLIDAPYQGLQNALNNECHTKFF